MWERIILGLLTKNALENKFFTNEISPKEIFKF